MALASVLAALYSSQKLALDPAGRHEKKMKSAFSGETCNMKVVSNYEKMLSMYSLGAKISGIIPQRAPVQLLHCDRAAPVGCQHPSTKFPLPKNALDGRQFALQADQKHSTIAGIRDHPTSLPRLFADLVLSIVCLACRLGFDGLESYEQYLKTINIMSLRSSLKMQNI